MTTGPLEEIRQLERSVALAIADATAESASALDEARRDGEELVTEARSRGLATAEQRYQDGLARARDEAEKILSDGDGRVAALRRQADAHLSAAVDLVMAMVLPIEEGG
jgi:vacuolar-type H+-ATPase subunit H